MTKQTDANRNTLNPLAMRSRDNGGRFMSYKQVDQNYLNLLRVRDTWNNGNLPYLKNEVVFYRGGMFAALADTSEEPSRGAVDWFPLSGFAGHGGMVLNTPTGGSIGAGWATVPYDSVDVPAEGCTLDTAANTFAVDWPGTWQIGVFFNVSHNESNQSREFDARLYNVTAASGGTELPIYVARNQPGTMLSTNFLTVIPLANVGDVLRVEIGGSSDSFSSVTYQSTGLDLIQVSVG